jgi:MSHA biogenesis protein MshK
VLQSVFLPRKGKPFAVIGGQTVKLGEMYGDSRLVKLSEREAVLDGPAGIESLLLTPGIEKTNIIAKTITKTPVAKRAPRGSTP